MTKFMDQRTFECAALSILVAHNSGAPPSSIASSFSEFRLMFTDENLYMKQISEVVEFIEKSWEGISQIERKMRAERLFNTRRDLDEDLNPKNFMKKIFAGPAFIKSHPNPNNRAAKAIENIQFLEKIII
jgi:hypothetical protein